MTSLALALFLAAVPTVTVSGKVYTPSGAALGQGTVVAKLSRPVSISDGATFVRVAGEVAGTISPAGMVSIKLAPNDQAIPAESTYRVTFDGRLPGGRRAVWSETWSIASSPTTLDLANVTRVETPAVSAGSREVVDVAVVQETIRLSQQTVLDRATQAVADLAATGTPANSNGNSVAVTATGATTPRTLAVELADVFKPERYGCAGDGVTDDYACLQALVAAVNAKGGGVIELRPKATYRVDRYIISGGGSANGVTTLVFTGLNGLVIRGNGAKIDMKGDFNRSWDYTGSAPDFYRYSYRNTIGLQFTHCTKVTIEDLEIDGNSDLTTKDASVGEGPSNGLTFQGGEKVVISNVWLHHYPSDGLIIREYNDGSGVRVASKHFTVSNSIFEYNGRQGMSITAGRWLTFLNTKFQHQGRAAYGFHSPGAGVDIEPDYWPGGSSIGYAEADEYSGDILFIGCHFENNRGQEFVAGQSRRRDAGHTITIDGPLLHPVTVMDSQFIGNPVESSRVVPSGRSNHFIRCRFKDLEFKPEYSADGPQRAKHVVEDSTFEHSQPALSAIRWLVTDGELLVRNSTFLFQATSPALTNLLYVQISGTARAKLEGSSIWIDGRNHSGAGRNTSLRFEGSGGELENNRWETDLATGGAFFQVSAGTYRNETYLSQPYVGPLTGVYSKATYSTPVVASQVASVAADVATLKTDFNALLTKLRDANLVAP